MRRALTSRTKLDSLRKEAKRWLKRLRAGDAEAAARLKAALPKPPVQPGLRDVQHALALEYGCDDWIALKAALAERKPASERDADRLDTLLRHGWSRDTKAAQRILARHPELARESLFTAATCGLIDEVERRVALDPQAATHVGGPMNWTALAYVTYGRLDSENAVAIARLLLDAGANPNSRFDDGWGSPFTVLTGAIGLGEGAKPTHALAAPLVELLVEAGAEPYDLQALYNVSIVGDDLDWYELLWRLCEAKGDLDKWTVAADGRLGYHVGKNSLDYLLGNAVGQNNIRRTAWLIERGADPGTSHWQTGGSLLALAELSGFREIADLLGRRGAALPPLSGAQALIAACMRQDGARASALLAAEPDLIRDPHPLLAAAAHGAAQATEMLLSLGADPHALDHDGISPLHRAVQAGSWDVANLLLEAGAEVDLRERKWKGTPLSWAAVLGRPYMAERLAPLSRDVRALASLADRERLETVLESEPALANHRLDVEDAPTPLFCLPDDEDAAMELAEILLRHGADAKLRNNHGQTPAQMARRRGLDDAADLIEEAAHG
jgi:ankyrin repeat protein